MNREHASAFGADEDTSMMNLNAGPLSRRQAIARVAGLGLGAMTMLKGGTAMAQGGGVQAIPPPTDPRFPMPPTWDTQLKEVAPNVYAYIQAGGPGRNNVSVSDAGIIVGDDSVMVIDTLSAPFHARDFIAAIRTVTDKPFAQVINTHHHGDHIGGNQYFLPAEFISHPYCREEVAAAAARTAPMWAKREGWADGTEPRKVVPANVTVDGKLTYHYGGNVVEILPMLPAHTYGDLVVYIPEHKVMFLGDIGFFYVAPFCQNAHPSNWIEICKNIEGMDVETVVPGHGPIGGKAELADMRGYLERLKQEAKRRYDARMTAGVAAADIRLGKYDNWIGPERIIMDTVRFYDEFAGTLKPAVNQEANTKATEEYNAARKAR